MIQQVRVRIIFLKQRKLFLQASLKVCCVWFCSLDCLATLYEQVMMALEGVFRQLLKGLSNIFSVKLKREE